MKKIKYPSFLDYKSSSRVSSVTKSKNRNSNTKNEVLLRSTLHKMGMRFKKNVRNLPGKPDIVFPKSRIVVFCDGDFWHGRDWKKLKNKLRKRANSDYWITKISCNMMNDGNINKELEGLGWIVLRFWETEILKNTDIIAEEIASYIRTE